MYGGADGLFPQKINRISYQALKNAYGDSGRLTIDEIAGRGHKTKNSDWRKVQSWLNCVKSKKGTCFSGAQIIFLTTMTAVSSLILLF